MKRLNKVTTTCSDGVARAECYVPSMDSTAVTTDEKVTAYVSDRMANGYALARGTLAAKTYRGYGNLGVLRATEIWDSATSTPPTGTVYRVRDSGIRCVGVAPCASLHTANLNTTTSRNITHLNLEAVPNVSSTATAEARGDIGEGLSILVSGTITTKSNRVTLTATQFYRPLQIPSA